MPTKIRKLRVGTEKNKPICIYYSDTSDVLAYIPDGKTTFAKRGSECKQCDRNNLKLARTIARLLNLELTKTVKVGPYVLNKHVTNPPLLSDGQTILKGRTTTKKRR